MNNKEKRTYISKQLLSLSIPYFYEMPTLHEHLKLTPKCLFKFRPFDKFAWEMLEEPYVFLTPVKNLDDPFDCCNKPGLEGFFDPTTKRLTKKGLSFVVDYAAKHYNIEDIEKSKIKKTAMESMTDEGVDAEAFTRLATFGMRGPDQLQSFLIVLRTINRNINDMLSNPELIGLAESSLFPKDRIGVCSLSELRDNKVMWSLYGDLYSGYCVEYVVQDKRDIISNLCPVIYTKKANNGFYEMFLRYALSALMRGASSGRFGGDEIGAIMELFCTKDADWSYQREWRMLGKPSAHVYMPIKAVYLGFRAAERNKVRMIRLAKKKGFAVYSMNQPDGTKRIKYNKLLDGTIR